VTGAFEQLAYDEALASPRSRFVVTASVENDCTALVGEKRMQGRMVFARGRDIAAVS
jgi:hypothetical protein